MAERLRAGGTGIPAFFTASGVGTMVADGGLPWRYGSDGQVTVSSPPKETRLFSSLGGSGVAGGSSRRQRGGRAGRDRADPAGTDPADDDHDTDGCRRMSVLREVVICEPLRTPIGRFGGVFKTVAPADLAATVIAALIERTGLDGAVVDDVIFGQAYPTAEAASVARVAALNAGLR